MDEIERTRNFVKQQFQENPHYSFNDWSVMYEHSCNVEQIASEIAKTIPSNKLLVSLGALLHDIGKTYDADLETLHKNHQDYNLEVSTNLISELKLSKEDTENLEKLITYQSSSPEMNIIKDADALAIYADKRLYMLFIEWAAEGQMTDAIQRKIDKFSNLNYDVSKNIGFKWYENMKKDWEPYLKDKGLKINFL